MDARLVRPSWRGRTNVDALTIACIERAESIMRSRHKKIAHLFAVTQGSYQSSVAASAGTHDGGGAVDLMWCGHVECVRALREAGMAAWHRNPSQGKWKDHIHAVVVDHPKLAPSAARQITAYRARRNGLANNAADDGPRLDPIPGPVWPWPPPKPAPTRGKLVDVAESALVGAIQKAKANGKPLREKRLRATLTVLRKVARK